MPDNARKYLLYAAGEILLVMIGILLALQVNNWNEDRKDRQVEFTLLQQILIDIKDDREDLEETFLRRFNIRKQGLLDMKKLITTYPPPPDSLVLRTFRDMRIDFYFTFESATYESLKANGLDKVSNPELRLFLPKVYESILPRMQTFLYSYSELDDLYEEIKRDWMTYNLQDGPDGEPVMRPALKPGFIRSDILKYTIEVLENDVSNKERRFNSIMSIEDDLIELLEQEISSRTS